MPDPVGVGPSSQVRTQQTSTSGPSSTTIQPDNSTERRQLDQLFSRENASRGRNNWRGTNDEWQRVYDGNENRWVSNRRESRILEQQQQLRSSFDNINRM